MKEVAGEASRSGQVYDRTETRLTEVGRCALVSFLQGPPLFTLSLPLLFLHFLFTFLGRGQPLRASSNINVCKNLSCPPQMEDLISLKKLKEEMNKQTNKNTGLEKPTSRLNTSQFSLDPDVLRLF